MSEPSVNASGLDDSPSSFGSREVAWFAGSLTVARCTLIPTGRACNHPG